MKVLNWGLIPVLNVKNLKNKTKTFQSLGRIGLTNPISEPFWFFEKLHCNLKLIVASVDQKRVINVPITFYSL